jgi:hypothetical protein
MEKIESTLGQDGGDNFLDNSQIKEIEEATEELKEDKFYPQERRIREEKLEETYKNLKSREFVLSGLGEIKKYRRQRIDEMRVYKIDRGIKKISPDKVMERSTHFYKAEGSDGVRRYVKPVVYEVKTIEECINECKEFIKSQEEKIKKVEEVVSGLQGK